MHDVTVTRITIATTFGAMNGSFRIFETISVKTNIANVFTIVILDF